MSQEKIVNGPAIISCGFFRTGTTSVCLALEELGIGKCYHPVLMGFHYTFNLMDQLCNSLLKYENNEINFNDIDLDKYYKELGCQVWFDLPFAPYWKEIANYYNSKNNNVKILLTIRDFDGWYKSVLNVFDLVYPWYIKYIPYKYIGGRNYLLF